MKSTDTKGQERTGMLAFNRWLDTVGITPITGWRWRKLGFIETVNIMGRVYISSAEIERFTKRAEAGEFSKDHPVPINGRAR